MSEITSLPEVQAVKADVIGAAKSAVTQFRSLLDGYFTGAAAGAKKFTDDVKHAAEAVVTVESSHLGPMAKAVVMSFMGVADAATAPAVDKLGDAEIAQLAALRLRLDSYPV